MGTTASFWMGRKKLKIFKVALIVCDGVLVESTDDTFPTDSASSDSEYPVRISMECPTALIRAVKNNLKDSRWTSKSDVGLSDGYQ
ncbi:hypothetical protein OUZ56_010141 [Daphnia magna]|uniref:Uncharacterized protein n=1 Tax=Daphnia magna TaxID=35525 RepID=A0ABR0AHW6_9CRUS|nr:hypothetical protein OUZ56_010141 [Daphnia magna]